MTMSLKERFWAKVDRGELDECWEWNAAMVQGRGYIRDGDRGRYATRVVMELEGNDPEGVCVLHHCDNPACVNPEHLYLGDRDDNTSDRAERNRCARGESCGSSKLMEGDVMEIRARYDAGETQVGLAREYPVEPSTLGRIVRRETWTHLD